ncbi:MAG: T9SS type A sorting domain-containing protein, partial [Bacteroidota bacterium]|nr:T9SS type A sorting domain-containing protein [Bacteroidota bacterium]
PTPNTCPHTACEPFNPSSPIELESQIKSPDAESGNYSFYPNPFTSEAVFEYNLPRGTRDAVLTVYDMAGRAVRVYALTGSSGRLMISAAGMTGGVYYYHVAAAGGVLNTGKMILAY